MWELTILTYDLYPTSAGDTPSRVVRGAGVPCAVMTRDTLDEQLTYSVLTHLHPGPKNKYILLVTICFCDSSWSLKSFKVWDTKCIMPHGSQIHHSNNFRILVSTKMHLKPYLEFLYGTYFKSNSELFIHNKST